MGGWQAGWGEGGEQVFSSGLRVLSTAAGVPSTRRPLQNKDPRLSHRMGLCRAVDDGLRRAIPNAKHNRSQAQVYEYCLQLLVCHPSFQSPCKTVQMLRCQLPLHAQFSSFECLAQDTHDRPFDTCERFVRSAGLSAIQVCSSGTVCRFSAVLLSHLAVALGCRLCLVPGLHANHSAMRR